MILSLTLMPIGTAFIFPSITAMLSRVVRSSERGLYMGVQHTFGGVSRVLFPLATGYSMDRLGVGFPYVVAGIMVAATLLLTVSLEQYAQIPDSPSAVDIAMTQTSETPITPPATPAATSS
jgi:MFS family permease